MKLISNEEVYAAARAYSQKFANMTPESYADFTHKIEGMSNSEAKELLNEFTQTALMFYLNKVEGVKARNPLDKNGLIERFNMPFAGLKQNMYVKGKKPINPKFKNRVDGASVDPFQFTKGSVEDIFYTFNDDYQNTISIPDFDIKTAVANANGVAQIVQGYMQYLESMRIEWEKTHTLEVVNEMLNSVEHPLKDEQIEELTIADEDAITRDELKDLVALVNNTVDAMGLETTEAFNKASFPKLVEKDELVFLTKPGLKNTLKTQLLASAFNKDELNMDIEQVITPSFGGLVPTQDGTITTKLYMVYDSEGRPTDTYTTDAAGEVPYTGDVVWYDPNADVIGIIIEKGTLFIDEQNPYSVYGIYNPAGMYTTYWANKPNVGFHYDMYKNCVVIKKKISEPVVVVPTLTIDTPAEVETETASLVFTYANCTGAAGYTVDVNGSAAGGAALSDESGTITSVSLTETSEVKITILNSDNEEIISATKTITFN